MRIYKTGLVALFLAISLSAAGCGGKSSAPEVVRGADAGIGAEAAAETGDNTEPEAGRSKTDYEKEDNTPSEKGDPEDGAKKTDAGGTAAEGETGSQVNMDLDGLEPVYGNEIKDGLYSINVDSSSSMFRITGCELTVKDGAMSAVMTMGGTGYLRLYMGTGEEALKASDTAYIPYVEKQDGTHTFEVPVEALDMEINCSAFSKNKEKWYDRVLVFRADSLPQDACADGKITSAESLKLEDGTYTADVALEGGSGRATLESPAKLRVENGNVTAVIVWGSSNYDYMKVDGQKYELKSTEGNSTFEIPVSGFDWKIPVIADTIAMSEPHEITYTLTFDSATLEKVE